MASLAKRQDRGHKHVHFDLVNTNGKSATSATPMIAKPPPTLIPGKKVFLEEYANSNSPEWTRFENPIVFMEDEVLPEEMEEAELEQRSTTEAPAEEVCVEIPDNRKPEPSMKAPRWHPLSQVTSDAARRHPLSQVINVEDMPSPIQSRLKDAMDRGGGAHLSQADNAEGMASPIQTQSGDAAGQGYRGSFAPITIISDSEDEDGDREKFLDVAVTKFDIVKETITVSDDDEDDEAEVGHIDVMEELLHGANEEVLDFSIDEDDEEEGPDDTFEFKFSSNR